MVRQLHYSLKCAKLDVPGVFVKLQSSALEQLEFWFVIGSLYKMAPVLHACVRLLSVAPAGDDQILKLDAGADGQIRLASSHQAGARNVCVVVVGRLLRCSL